MRSPFSVTMGLAMGLVIGMFAHTPQAPLQSPDQTMTAAYRDGAFLASLDAENGRKPHLASGRWSENTDRASFIAGYEQAYESVAGNGKASFPRATSAEVAGYTDGMADAASDEASSHSFQPEKTNHYVNAGNSSSQVSEGLVSVQQEYRDAYLNGYQHRYFSNQEGSAWSYYAQ